MKVGVFHPGTQHSWQSARGFHEAGVLAWYATSIFSKHTDRRFRVLEALPRAIGGPLARELRRRSYPPLDDAPVVEFGGVEWLEIAARRLGLRRLSDRLNRIGNVQFDRQVGALVRRSDVTAVMGANTSSLGVFERCPPGVLRILDQTIGHPDEQRRILSAEYERHPEAFLADPTAIDEGWLARQRREHALADAIICASNFTRATMLAGGVDPGKLHHIPNGFPDEWLDRPLPPFTPRGPLKLMFLGTLSARKGAYYLLEAMRGIPATLAMLTLVGRIEVPPAFMARYQDHVTLLRQVPKSGVFDSLLPYDVQILPSLFEGGSLALHESIGVGMPIIHTAASGHPDYGNGIRLDTLSVEGLRDAIVRLATDRDALIAAHRRSMEVRPSLTWSHNRRAVVALAARPAPPRGAAA